MYEIVFLTVACECICVRNVEMSHLLLKHVDFQAKV